MADGNKFKTLPLLGNVNASGNGKVLWKLTGSGNFSTTISHKLSQFSES